MDFLPTLKQPRLMLFEMFYCRRIYLVVSSIFHWACGSISNVLDYKNVTWTTPNLVTVTYDFCFSLRAPNKVWLVPLMNLVNIWNQYDGDADEVLDYFEDTYIGHFRTNAPRRPHLFPMKLWNRFHRTAEELPRTNNNIEAWHNSFQANVSSIHPTFRKFLDVLLSEERNVWEECFKTKQDMHQNHNDADTLILMPVLYELSTII